MKKFLFSSALIALGLLFFSVSHAKDHEDILLHKNCKVCGMSREMFSYSRVLVEYSNGTVSGTCGIRCASVDLALNMGRKADSIKVADFNTRDLIEAEKAFWVIGGKRQGTMSTRGKWAFAKKSDADAFMGGNGGVSGSFYDALKASFDDLYSDLKLFWDDLKKRKDD